MRRGETLLATALTVAVLLVLVRSPPQAMSTVPVSVAATPPTWSDASSNGREAPAAGASNMAVTAAAAAAAEQQQELHSGRVAIAASPSPSTKGARVALIMLVVGSSFPPWWPFLVTSYKLNHPTSELSVVHTGKRERATRRPADNSCEAHCGGGKKEFCT